MRSANVVALLSEYEAHPVAVMEALAEGVDVVVAATSGMNELGREGLVRTVDLAACPETVADALLTAAEEHRWAAGPAALPSCTDMVDDGVTGRLVVPGDLDALAEGNIQHP